MFLIQSFKHKGFPSLSPLPAITNPPNISFALLPASCYLLPCYLPTWLPAHLSAWEKILYLYLYIYIFHSTCVCSFFLKVPPCAGKKLEIHWAKVEKCQNVRLVPRMRWKDGKLRNGKSVNNIQSKTFPPSRPPELTECHWKGPLMAMGHPSLNILRIWRKNWHNTAIWL